MTLIEIRARVPMTSPQHVYEVRPRKDHRVVDLVSDALPFGSLWYTKPDDAIEYAKFRTAFGQPIGAFQSVQHTCADMQIWVDGGELLTFEALWKIDQGLPASVDRVCPYCSDT